MGDRGAGESWPPSRSAWLLPSNGRRGRARRHRGGGRRVGATRGLARRAALSDAVARVAGGGALDQRAAEHCAHPAALSGGCARPPLGRAADLALLHDVRRSRRPRIAARQLPGNAEPGGGASHVAHEHRTVPAVHGGRARFRLDRHARGRRASRGHARDDERPRAFPRPLLQLVRHEAWLSSRAEVRFVGRQRQSRRPSHRARARLRGDDRPPAPRSGGARRDRRRRVACPPGDGRRGRRCTPAPGHPRAPGGGYRRRHGDRPGAPARLGGVGLATRGAERTRSNGAGHRASAGRRKSGERANGRPRLGGGALRHRRKPHARPRHARDAHSSSHDPRPGRAGAGRRHGLRLSLRSNAEAVRDRVPRHGRQSRPRSVRPPRIGSPSRELRRDRQGRRPRLALVPAGPGPHPGGTGLGARVLVGIDVRIPDADARHARAGGQPARADIPARRGPADQLWRRARRAVGGVGVGLQRARSRNDLPVFELRCAGARTATRTQRGRRHRALRDGSGGDDRSDRGDAELPAPGGRRGQRRLRLLRGARLHRAAASGGGPGRGDSRLYGAPPGDGGRRDRERHPLRRDGAIGTTLQVIVSPEDDAEVRRVSLTNLGTKSRVIELTSYAEVVLAPPAADAAHPAFSNLSVQTECVLELDTLLATRRPRSRGEAPVWLAHVVVVEGDPVGELQWETDRARFLGRGRGIRTPAAVIDGRPLSNTTGAVLDPIVSLRRRVRLPPGDTVRVAFSTLVAPSRAEALGLAEKYRDTATFDRAATLAWTQAQVQQHHLGIGPDEAHLFQSLASRVLYSDRALRPSADVLTRHTGGPDALWAHGISGDLPIVLVQIDEPEDVGIVRQLLRAHEYWRMKQLAVDLVILNERAPSYVQDLQALLETLLRTSQSAGLHDGQGPHGKVHILRADRVTATQRDVLQSVARAVLSSRRGTLADQMARTQRPDAAPLAQPRRPAVAPADVTARRPDLELFNGLGGFAGDGREYVTVLEAGRWTPAPWINVIANPGFGFQVSESGSGYTWSVNSRENQLTAWSNDPVSDPPGETIYVRDEETGDLWGPTALPIHEGALPYVIRHGQGYTRFEHVSHGIALELLQLVPLDDPIKISRLTLRNESGRPRRLSVTAYVEWVLGVSRPAAAPFVVTEIDGKTGAMFARNAWRREFGDRVAFADLGGTQAAWTADRTEFLGRNGTPDHPAALAPRRRLSGRVGAGLDPCSALQTTIELAAGGRAEVMFFLGEAANPEQARELIVRHRTRDVAAALRAVGERWDAVLGTVQVKTPDRSMDILLNRWLLYQTLACRLWARSALYQAGGAYGFRDQLQDVMALAVAEPALARQHVLRAAARQFVEGDVQHWWHPPRGRGVRTRISDDLVWLPYVVSQYVEVAGDGAVLDEVVPFLEGPKLAVGQSESYFEPRASDERGTLFEHCARALDHSLTAGSHGLPLMGTGDWNDGMNAVGAEGKGESVWLGWFLHAVLSRWADLADARGEGKRAARWRSYMNALKQSLEREAWDGHWYRRAYFDDGTPLGAAVNDACRIDSIAQSWSVISAAADPARRA